MLAVGVAFCAGGGVTGGCTGVVLAAGGCGGGGGGGRGGVAGGVGGGWGGGCTVTAGGCSGGVTGIGSGVGGLAGGVRGAGTTFGGGSGLLFVVFDEAFGEHPASRTADSTMAIALRRFPILTPPRKFDPNTMKSPGLLQTETVKSEKRKPASFSEGCRS